MRILISEDNKRKAKAIESVCLEFDDVEIVRVRTIVELINLNRDKVFDLAILDVLMPLTTGDGVVESCIPVLRDLLEEDKRFIASHIVGLTAEHKIVDANRVFFETNGWALLLYDDGGAWKDCISSIIQRMVAFKHRPPSSSCHYAIICGLRSELSAVLSWDIAWRTKWPVGFSDEVHEGTFIDKNGMNRRVVAVHCSQMGLAAAASTTTKVIMEYRPLCLVMPGISAGTNREKSSYGDILIADPSWDYASGKVTGGPSDPDGERDLVFLPSSYDIPIDHRLMRKIDSYQQSGQWKKFFLASDPSEIERINNVKVIKGRVACGVQVVSVKKIPDLLKARQRDVNGIDMESYGMYLAAVTTVEPKPLFFSCKSVSDFADSKKDDLLQDFCMRASAAFLKGFLTEGDCIE